MEEEKTAIHAEYEQERIAYQKLLKEYNMLEAANDDLKEKVNVLRGDKHDRTISNVSMTSSVMNEDDFTSMESAYGGSSASSQNDVGLMMKLQNALKEAHRERDQLEKRLEEAENTSGSSPQQSTDLLKLQDLEIENNKLREDMTKLRKSIADTTDNDNEAVREMADQYEMIQEELDRVKAECLQLRSVLANVQLSGSEADQVSLQSSDNVEEVLQAYETQKKVIQQLQSSLNIERDRANKSEKEMKVELEKLRVLSADQQSVIQTGMNKTPANQQEAFMQHELTRLTGENFDMREQNEAKEDQIKRLKRQMKMYMKRLQEAGMMASIVEIEERENRDHNDVGEGDQSMPVILKKESDQLGMLEYNKDQEDKLLRAIITELKPRTAAQMLPGLPAYVMFMLIRHLDHINDDRSVRTLIQGAISHVKKTIKKRGQTDIELKTLWLSNTLRLLHCLKQYSGEEQFQNASTEHQKSHCLRNFDLSAYRRVLSDIAVWIYQGITKVMEEEIQPVLVIALLEHEGISNLTNDKPRPQHRARAGSNDNNLDSSGHLDPKEALDQLLTLLTKFHMTLQKHGLDPEIISQIFRQIFYYLCAGSLNNLLLRKDMCHWSRGMQIRYNVAQLEQWARDQNLENEGTKVIDTLGPVIQATQLLQARKTEEDVTGICEMCDKLRVSQIIKILNLYTPADEFEERVSPAFVRKIQNKLQERAMEEAKNQVRIQRKTVETFSLFFMYFQVTLLMDTKFSFAVRFPFNPSNINLAELEIPELYSGVTPLVRKV